MIERHRIADHDVEVIRVLGAEAGPTIVLLHEALGCLSLWRDFPEQLAAATGCEVVAWSRWGYGRSEPRPAPWPFEYHETEATEAIPDLLSVLGIGPHVLWGHSDGATIALLNAGLAPSPDLLGVISVAGHVVVETTEELEATARWFEQGDLRRRLAKHHADPDTVFGEWLRIWTDPEFRDWDIRPAVASTLPTLVMQGAEDAYATPGHVDLITGAVGGQAVGRLLEGSGHHPMFDATDSVLQATTGFVRVL